MQVGARCGSQREVGTGWGVGPWGDSPLRAAAVSWTSGLILWARLVSRGHFRLRDTLSPSVAVLSASS